MKLYLLLEACLTLKKAIKRDSSSFSDFNFDGLAFCLSV